MTVAEMLWVRARVSPYAVSRLLTTVRMSASSRSCSMASMIAWRLVPPPESSTPMGTLRFMGMLVCPAPMVTGTGGFETRPYILSSSITGYGWV